MAEHNGVEDLWVRVDDPLSHKEWNVGVWRNIAEYHDGIFQSPTYWEHFVQVAKVPTMYGIYSDRQNDVWILNDDGWSVHDRYGTFSSGVTDHPAGYLPFTLIHKFDNDEEED